MDACITKPIDIDRFLQVIGAILKQKGPAEDEK